MELKKDIGVGVVSSLIGAWVVFYTGSLREGPAFFPRLVGIGLILIGVVLAGFSTIKLVKIKRADLTSEEKTEEEVVQQNRIPSWRVFAIIGCLVTYYLLFNLIGYIIPTFLAVCSVAFILGYRKWKVLVPTALLTSVGLYMLFTLVFSIKFPGIFY